MMDVFGNELAFEAKWSAFGVKVWPDLVSKEYLINANMLLQVARIGPTYLGEFAEAQSCGTIARRVFGRTREDGRLERKSDRAGVRFFFGVHGSHNWRTIRITMTKVGRSRLII